MTAIIPQHEYAEEAILGIMICEPPAVVKRLRIMLQPEDFTSTSNQQLYRILLRLHDQHGVCDYGTLIDFMRDTDQQDMQDVGGWEYVNKLTLGGLPADAAPTYARIIKEASCRRRVQRLATEMLTRTDDVRWELPDIIEQSIRQLRDSLPPSARNARPLYDLALEERTRISKELDEGVSSGFRTGWSQLNRRLAPIRPGQLVMIGARPGMGKTAFALNWALALAEQKLPGVIYSLEMEDTELSLRALLRYTNIKNSELNNPSELKDQKEGVLADIDKALEQLPNGILINDKNITISDMFAELRELIREKPIIWVIVDFLQLAKADKNYRSRAEEVGAMAYELADMSKEFGISIIALSQLSREVDKESPRRPRKDHFLESGKIEAAADRMIYLYRPSEYGKRECEAAGYPTEIKELTEVGILKQRQAKSTGKTVLFFDGEHFKFRNLNPDEKQALGWKQHEEGNDD